MVYAKFGGQTECIMGNWKIENGKMTRKPRRYVKILIYMSQTWAITVKKFHTTLPYKHVEIEVT